MNQPPQQQVELPGLPVPIETAVAMPVRVEGGWRIPLLITSFNGRFGFYLEPSHAKQLAAALELYATQAETGLVLPPGAMPS